MPPLANILEANSSEAFRGFALPTSNTTYTPNQFFDVCLPHYSRGCVRLVAFLIRKTLGWCDAQGNPQAERHLVSYGDLEAAGINRDMIRSAIDEAVKHHFIQCVRPPSMQTAGHRAASGLYELKWDEGGEYVKDPKEFRGFFSGEGNRTYIPNQFFDLLIPSQTLAVAKVVGSVIRFSIGYQNKWGHRRRQVSLSFQHIQNYARLKDRTTLSKAVRHAMESNFIERVEEGYFDPDAGKLSKAAVYGVKWLNPGAELVNGRKTLPGKTPLAERSEMPTGHGRKTRPGERSEIQTDIEIKQTNKTLKQKQDPEAAASFEKLKEAGFDDVAARAMALKYSFDRVERQINWLADRNAKSNRLGLLRRSIEENWQSPASSGLGQPNSGEQRGEGFAGALERIKSRYWDQSSSK